ncbi:uncharacterized protein LOC142336589 [Convolutriloba macropyga]|uniref:uncharacterized protein LOC142336589 n=1 Tax=Convolutriloba macropyga TaxID=536237 RepID=UPI003F51C8EF
MFLISNVMSYKLILLLSAAFIALLMLTIVQQIVSFVQTQRNPVSSINVIRSDNGFIESSVIFLSAFVVSAISNDSVELNYGKFPVVDRCQCLNSSAISGYNWTACQRIMHMNHSSLDAQALIFEAPVNYGATQTEAVICEHPDHHIIVFMFIVVAQDFDTIKQQWTKLVLVISE